MQAKGGSPGYRSSPLVGLPCPFFVSHGGGVPLRTCMMGYAVDELSDLSASALLFFWPLIFVS